MDPALRDDAVVGTVHAGRDRARDAGQVDMRPGRRGAVRVGDLFAARDVAVAHVGLDVAEVLGGAWGRRSRRIRRPDGRAGVGRLRRLEEDEGRQEGDAGEGGDDDDRGPVALHERRLVGHPLAFAAAVTAAVELGRTPVPVGRGVAGRRSRPERPRRRPRRRRQPRHRPRSSRRPRSNCRPRSTAGGPVGLAWPRWRASRSVRRRLIAGSLAPAVALLTSQPRVWLEGSDQVRGSGRSRGNGASDVACRSEGTVPAEIVPRTVLVTVRHRRHGSFR